MTMYYACDYSLHAPAYPERETSNDLVLWWLLNCTQPWQGEEYFSDLTRDVLEQEAPLLPWQLLQSQSHPSTESSRSWLVEDKSDGDFLRTESPFTTESSLQAHEAALDHHEHCKRYLQFQNAGVNDFAGNVVNNHSSGHDDTLFVSSRLNPAAELTQYQNQIATPVAVQDKVLTPNLKMNHLANLNNPTPGFFNEYSIKAEYIHEEYKYYGKVRSLAEKRENLICDQSKDLEIPKGMGERVDVAQSATNIEEAFKYPQKALDLPGTAYHQSASYHQSTPIYMRLNLVSTCHDQPVLANFNAQLPEKFINSLMFPGLSINYHDQIRSSETPNTATTLNHQNNGRCRVIRGVSLWGGVTDPPASTSEHYVLVPIVLQIFQGGISECCHPKWLPNEELDGRRIIRLRRQQRGAHITVHFSIVGSAIDHPASSEATPNDTDILEVSCIRCLEQDEVGYQYYITSVEVVGIVELLVGTEVSDAAERRRERGRVRSNLVTYWSKKPILTRKHITSDDRVSAEDNMRMELARRIMGYETRRPRGFDKEVRILAWANLVPAMIRALNSYYAEVRR